jgi:hypothetical protein
MPAQQIRRAMLRRPRRLRSRDFVPDPEQADQEHAARHEMRAFDALPANARCAIAESKFGVHVAEAVRLINRCGICDDVRRVLKAKGLSGSDVGTEGVLLEQMTLMEKSESARLAAEIERRVPPRSTHAMPATPFNSFWR